MASQDAIRDGNYVTSLLLESSTNPGVTVRAKGDESNGRLLTSSSVVSAGYQQPTSGVLNQASFTWTVAPSVIVVDQGRMMQKVSTDGTINWTGTTTTILTVWPTSDIYSIA